MTHQQKFQNLLMDLDGTLIHSGSSMIPLKFVSGVLPLMKIHKGWKAALRALSESNSIVKIPSKDKTNHQRMVEVFQKRFSIPYEEAEKHLLQSLMKVFPKLESHFGEIQGAAGFVDWAKDYFTLTLTTNPVWPIELVQMRMRWGGIHPDYFRSITTADRMHSCKPSVEYYEEVLAQEKFEAHTCLLIGNERKMDLPATKAGIAVFLIRPDAKAMTCIETPGSIVNGAKSPGAWRGNYDHLKKFLTQSSI